MRAEYVCKLPNEAAYLHAAISEFSCDGPRAKYANWLAKQGDTPRAKDIHNTIEAFQNLDSAPLESLNGNDDWQRLIGAPLLKAFIKSAKSFDRDKMIEFRNLVFSKLRPALSMSYTLSKIDPPLGTSRLWGLPDLPIGQEWPQIKMASNWFDAQDDLPPDNHCAFLGQFSFSDFSNTVFGQELPKTGGFSVFTITEVHKLGIVETLVMPWDNQAELARAPAPSDLLEDKLGDETNMPKPVHEILLKEVLSLPDPTDGPFKKIINYWGFGGYLHGTSGADPSPDINSMRLAVLRVNPDCSVVHFAIPSEDLPLGKLERAEYVWSDWDS